MLPGDQRVLLGNGTKFRSMVCKTLIYYICHNAGGSLEEREKNEAKCIRCISGIVFVVTYILLIRCSSLHLHLISPAPDAVARCGAALCSDHLASLSANHSIPLCAVGRSYMEREAT